MSAPFALALLGLLAFAAWSDLCRRQIPNWIVGMVAALWLVAAATGDARPVWSSMAIAAAVLVVGITVWRFGWLGGGDVKLIATLSLWAGPGHLASLLLATALCGGLLALTVIFASRLAESPMTTLLQFHAARLVPAAMPQPAKSPARRPRSLPYGLAVALGGCWLVHLLLA